MHLLFTLHASIANRLIVFDKIVNLTILVQVSTIKVNNNNNKQPLIDV